MTTRHPRDLVTCDCEICGGKTVERVVSEVHNDPAAMASIRRGIEDWKAGRVTPWSELKRK